MFRGLVHSSPVNIVARLCLHPPLPSPHTIVAFRKPPRLPNTPTTTNRFTTTSSLPCTKPSSASMAPAGQKRGAFILFEGIDRSGKTTQCSKLVEHLVQSRIDAELWRFPDRTSPLGQMINSYLTNGVELVDNTVHLMFAANRWEKSKALLEALEAGKTLVVDRYSYSGLAYTLAKQVPGMDAEWCWSPEVGLPAPDIVFYMRVSPEVSASRSNYGEERYEKAEFQKMVASKFDSLQDDGWVVVDASQPIDVIHGQVCAATDALLASGRLQQPVRKFQTLSATSRGDCSVVVQLGNTKSTKAAEHAEHVDAGTQADRPVS